MPSPICCRAAARVHRLAQRSCSWFEFERWSRHISKEIAIALELGAPPEFDGRKCIKCGKRFRPERDHTDPVANSGPTMLGNLGDHCHECHLIKTAEDLAAGKPGPKPGKRKPGKKPPEP